MAIKIAKKIKIEMPITELVSKADNKNFDLQTEVENMMKRPPKPVSYTHLTLPTICSV